MRKVISISLSFFMLLAVLHLYVATHYCEGEKIATVVSLSGKLALACHDTELPEMFMQTYPDAANMN